MSTRDAIDAASHDAFVRKYDFEVLDSVKGSTWFNVMHVNGANAMIREVQDYPVHALSWHDRDDGPSMDEVRTYSDKAFIGGLSWGKMVKTNVEVCAEVRETVAATGQRCDSRPGMRY